MVELFRTDEDGKTVSQLFKPSKFKAYLENGWRLTPELEEEDDSEDQPKKRRGRPAKD